VITGILVALPEELRTLSNSKIRQGECIATAKNTVTILSGSGSENAAIAAQKLLDHGAKQLISWGCAGALAPHLKAGDLVIPTLIQMPNNTKLSTHTQWSRKTVKLLENTIKCYNGKLLESESIISLASHKALQYQRTQALAVDMESGAVARIAAQAQVPFIAIRSIVDPAQLDLPKAINYAMNDQGTIAIPKLMFYLCMHPAELPRLVRLGLHFNAASKTLKHLAQQLPRIIQAQ